MLIGGLVSTAGFLVALFAVHLVDWSACVDWRTCIHCGVSRGTVFAVINIIFVNVPEVAVVVVVGEITSYVLSYLVDDLHSHHPI